MINDRSFHSSLGVTTSVTLRPKNSDAPRQTQESMKGPPAH